MITTYLDAGRRIGTYATMGGDVGIVRFTTVVDRPENPGCAAGESHREIVEAVFVAPEDGPTVELALVGMDPGCSIAPALAARGIGFRHARPVSTSAAQIGHGTRPTHSRVAKPADGWVDLSARRQASTTRPVAGQQLHDLAHIHRIPAPSTRRIATGASRPLGTSVNKA